jgi:hypothetical protein
VVEAGAGVQAVILGERVGALGEEARLAERGVAEPRLGGERVDGFVGRVADRVGVVLRVETDGDPCGRDGREHDLGEPSGGEAIGIRDGAAAHARRGREGPQAEVVHHVVDVVAEEPRLDAGDERGERSAFQAEPVVLTIE